MSGFRAGSSSKTEQILLMMWLTANIVVLNVYDAMTLFGEDLMDKNLGRLDNESSGVSRFTISLVEQHLGWVKLLSGVFILPI